MRRGIGRAVLAVHVAVGLVAVALLLGMGVAACSRGDEPSAGDVLQERLESQTGVPSGHDGSEGALLGSTDAETVSGGGALSPRRPRPGIRDSRRPRRDHPEPLPGLRPQRPDVRPRREAGRHPAGGVAEPRRPRRQRRPGGLPRTPGRRHSAAYPPRQSGRVPARPAAQRPGQYARQFPPPWQQPIRSRQRRARRRLPIPTPRRRPRRASSTSGWWTRTSRRGPTTSTATAMPGSRRGTDSSAP